MMHGHEKSDSVIVAVKPANKAEQSAAEQVERRAGTKGNANLQARPGRRARQACHKRWSAYGKHFTNQNTVRCNVRTGLIDDEPSANGQGKSLMPLG
jgi:hypothetical protein